MKISLLNVWGGMCRMALRRHFTRSHWLALAGLLAVFALILISFLRGSNGVHEFLPFTAGFYFSFLVPLLAFISGGGAWRDDLKPAAADYFFLRPVPKWIYLIFRYGAQLICAEIDFLASLALLIALGSAYRVPGLGGHWPALLATQAMSVAAFSAFGFFCAALTERWVVIGLIYGAVVEGGLGSAPLAINRLAMTHQARAMLRPIMPVGWTGPDLAALSRAANPWTAAGLLAVFAVIWVMAAAAIFARDEIGGGGGSG